MTPDKILQYGSFRNKIKMYSNDYESFYNPLNHMHHLMLFNLTNIYHFIPRYTVRKYLLINNYYEENF